MIHANPTFLAEVEREVAAIETKTDAEIVVVMAARSGSYRDRTYLLASVGCLGLLALQIAIPHPLHPLLVLADLALAFPLLAWLLDEPRLLKRLVARQRQEAQVREAARAEFVAEAVHGTPHRTGVLVYVSTLEGQVLVLPDLGVEGHLAPGRLAMAVQAFRADDAGSFLNRLRLLGQVLAEALPHHEGSDLTNLPDTVRVRS